MYSKDFYIRGEVWNNAFSFSDRETQKLYVPRLKKIKGFNEIELLSEDKEKITFEEYDFEGKMQTCFGLKNLYELEWRWKKLYLVDNHNHVFYFWYLARNLGIISDDSLLYHIDEHADTRDSWKYLMKPDSKDLKKVFEYTNFCLNVWNYIVPAEREWLVWDTIQIRGENALEDYNNGAFWELEKENRKIILNLDLDFFEPELDFIDYELKKQVILDIADTADIITICTSPYFIDQERALSALRDIFDK